MSPGRHVSAVVTVMKRNSRVRPCLTRRTVNNRLASKVKKMKGCFHVNKILLMESERKPDRITMCTFREYKKSVKKYCSCNQSEYKTVA
jgi:hypothetical protein